MSNLDFIRDLENIYSWNLLLLIPFIIILLGAIFKKPPVPVMLLSCLTALIIGVAYQGFSLEDGFTAALSGFDSSMLPGISSDQLSEETLTLLNRGGIVSMVGVIVIIYCGYAYTAIISETGFLETALNPLTKRVKKRGPLMLTTLFTEFLLLVFSGTSYTIAIIVPEMFKKPFLKAGMAAKTLSRSMEDIGTIMACLVPWGQSGMFYITTLGVSVYGSDGYASWAVMAYITPVIAIFLAFSGIGIYKLGKKDKEEALAEYELSKTS
ncbi:hypothetical protein KFZ58_15635 [Virgibacillus sp. NKC19-16]|uniref:Na+/H+ antiporter NhaC family protein n=1 Tax=Virgibacillus salidurans TaxID=2831673 RepID=UPI001F47ABFD|nr:Na+/H+ antiporter NhaC family protein [Virgibacillus sp. NKC19-16]UJL45799.1 hypothetical protein KFZ58_15635 [Virgibacillus sp. NKC19-16]